MAHWLSLPLTVTAPSQGTGAGRAEIYTAPTPPHGSAAPPPRFERRRAGPGPPGAAPAVPAARGEHAAASPAGRPRPAPRSTGPSSAGSSARRRVSCSSPPLRLLRAAGPRDSLLRRLLGMTAATAAPRRSRYRRHRHFAGLARPPPIGRHRAASSGHWPRAVGAGRRTGFRTRWRAEAPPRPAGREALPGPHPRTAATVGR